MSIRPLGFVSLALLAALTRTSHADPIALGIGLEDGPRSETNTFGGVLELDARLTRYLSLRFDGRAAYFDQTADACDFDSSGTLLDATGGLRLDLVPDDRALDVLPYVAAGVGIATANVLGACRGSTAEWMTSPVFQGVVGVEFQSELPHRFSVRLEARAAFADFSPDATLAAQFSPGWEYQQLNVEYGLAALFVIRL